MIKTRKFLFEKCFIYYVLYVLLYKFIKGALIMNTVSQNETEVLNDYEKLMESLNQLEDTGPIETKTFEEITTTYPEVEHHDFHGSDRISIQTLYDGMSEMNTLRQFNNAMRESSGILNGMNRPRNVERFFQNLDMIFSEIETMHRRTSEEFARVLPVQVDQDDDFI